MDRFSEESPADLVRAQEAHRERRGRQYEEDDREPAVARRRPFVDPLLKLMALNLAAVEQALERKVA